MHKFSDVEKDLAKRMALAVNGGNWGTDYTKSQKIGWCLKVRWAAAHFTVGV